MFEEVNKIAIIAILKSVDRDILIRNLSDYLINAISDDPVRVSAILANRLPIPKIPQHSKVFGKYGTYKSYNHYHATVEYSYENSDTLYFKTQEDAKQYCDTGEKIDYSYTQSEEYQIEIKTPHENTSYCSVETWLKNAINEDNDEKESD